MFSALKSTAPATDSRSAAELDAGERHRDQAARRSRAASKSVAEIGPPPPRNEKLYKRYQFDLPAFLSECFPLSMSLSPLSADHIKIAERTQDAIIKGGAELFIVYRGFAKSTLQECSAVWAGGYGHSPFFVPLSAIGELALSALASIQYEFETNDILAEIFPEACHAARALEGVVQRARKQTCNGQKTNIVWSTRRCVLPTVEGFPGSGAIIWPKGITANLRGLRFKRADGTQVRPTFVMGDDLQTDESAANPAQCQKRINALLKTVMRLGGHKRKMSITINGTIIEPDDALDQLSDPKKFPMFRTLKVAMLKSFAKLHETEWLGTYAELRTTYNPDDDDDKERAEKAATAYYKKHRKRMDDGAVASWSTCYDEACELSAIQHSYNILIDTGENAFMAECQNNPRRDVGGLELLTPEQMARKQSEYPAGEFPKECTVLAFHADIHSDVIYYEVWAFEPNFTRYRIEAGTFPDQRRKYFAHRGITTKLRKLFAGMEDEAVLEAALDCFLHGHNPDDWPRLREDDRGILNREWIRADGVPLRIGSGLVDANGQARNVVVKVISRSKFSSIVRPSYGKGIGAKQAPMSSYSQTREQKIVGPEWIYTKPVAGEVAGVFFDANYWKTRFHRSMQLAKGSQGAGYLHKANPNDHRLAADHYTAERAKEVTVGSRTVYEFELLANRDNHFLDCAVGAMVAASRAGITNVKQQPAKARPKKKRKTTYYGQ